MPCIPSFILIWSFQYLNVFQYIGFTNSLLSCVQELFFSVFCILFLFLNINLQFHNILHNFHVLKCQTETYKLALHLHGIDIFLIELIIDQSKCKPAKK